jgi:hypothetical protein
MTDDMFKLEKNNILWPKDSQKYETWNDTDIEDEEVA